jgi:hypothetical protein
MRKIGSLLFILILLASSLIMVKPASSEITKPSVPEFTLKIVDNSYEVPPAYYTDPYTGKTTMTQAGHRVQNGTMDLIIKNQPFTSYSDGNHTIDLYYRIRTRGHYEIGWSSYYPDDMYGYPDYVDASTTEFTVISFKYGEECGEYGPILGEIPDGGQVDFQVQAFIGYYVSVKADVTPLNIRNPYYANFTGEISDWSNIQTISLSDKVFSISTSPNPSSSPNSIVSPLQNLTATPTQAGIETGVLFGLNLEQTAIILLGITVIVLAFALLFSRKRSIKTKDKFSNDINVL